jgi:hypothetical protein
MGNRGAKNVRIYPSDLRVPLHHCPYDSGLASDLLVVSSQANEENIRICKKCEKKS